MKITLLFICMVLTGCKYYIYRCPIVNPELRVCERTDDYIRTFTACKLFANYAEELQLEPVLICGPR